MLNVWNRFLNWVFRKRGSGSPFDPQKTVKINGIQFTIRKLNPLDYLAGAQVLKKSHDVYQRPDKAEQPIDQAMVEKIKQHYRDTLMASVVSVRLHGIDLIPSRKPVLAEDKGSKIHIENIMTDWFMAEELYAAILTFTYGKKKMKQFISRKTS